jgi:hypothetical protein
MAGDYMNNNARNETAKLEREITGAPNQGDVAEAIRGITAAYSVADDNYSHRTFTGEERRRKRNEVDEEPLDLVDLFDR